MIIMTLAVFLKKTLVHDIHMVVRISKLNNVNKYKYLPRRSRSPSAYRTCIGPTP